MRCTPRSMVLLYLAIVVLCGCAQQAVVLPPPVPSWEALGMAYHDTPVHPQGAMASAPSAAPPALETFARHVDALAHTEDLGGRGLVSAIDALADAVALVPSRRADLVPSIRQIAHTLHDSQLRASSQADLVRMALDQARVILATGTPRDRWELDRYANAVTRFSSAAALIDPERPLREQRVLVDNALHAAQSVIEVATGTSVDRSTPQSARR